MWIDNIRLCLNFLFDCWFWLVWFAPWGEELGKSIRNSNVLIPMNSTPHPINNKKINPKWPPIIKIQNLYYFQFQQLISNSLLFYSIFIIIQIILFSTIFFLRLSISWDKSLSFFFTFFCIDNKWIDYRLLRFFYLMDFKAFFVGGWRGFWGGGLELWLGNFL